jgi:LacI family transcriptional regulator
LTVLSLLLSKGAAFNGDYALISRDNEPFLNFLTPSVARYRADRHAFARRFSRAIMQVTRGRSLPAKPIRLIPNMEAGSIL